MKKMRAQLTINYVRYFSIWHIGACCTIVIIFNMYIGMISNVAECRPHDNEFIPWVYPSDLLPPPEGIKKDGLLQGVYASGHVKQPEIKYVPPIVNMKPIEYKEISLITYIKSWFSAESWHNWYISDVIDAQKERNIFHIPQLVTPILHLNPSLVLTTEAVNNVVNLLDLPHKKILLLENIDTVLQRTTVIFSQTDQIIVGKLTSPRSYIEPLVPTAHQDMMSVGKLHSSKNRSMYIVPQILIPEPFLVAQKSQICLQENIEMKPQLPGELLSNVPMTSHDNFQIEYPNNKKNATMNPNTNDVVMTPYIENTTSNQPDTHIIPSDVPVASHDNFQIEHRNDKKDKLNIPDIPIKQDVTPITISEPDNHIIPSNVPMASHDKRCAIIKSYLRYGPDFMQISYVDLKTEEEILDEIDMQYTIKKYDFYLKNLKKK